MTEQNEKVNAEQLRAEQVRAEEYVFSGEEVVTKVKELLHEGNVRRFTVYNHNGTVLLDMPLTVGLVGMTAAIVLAPVFSAIALLAGVVTKLSVKVERVVNEVDETK
ncbi:MAG: DUF4342 domain-containing protein [Anaerolineae bacterium]|nr:DUF4342 domain-containing protein [Anaerolineae bacterium]